ncbi:MAG TPA: 50S ribosomal protein L31e [Nitrososphaera sp.]|jgi:large subunit ribosomal protein L31e|nr:50S ribosomal protein L31e [Nitrososphaera sp.]
MATVENLTRVYTINLGRAWLTPQYKRTDRVVNMIREFAQKHMKSDEIKLEQELNRQLWSRGKTNPPRNVRVKMVKDEDGVVTVSLYEDTPEAAVEEKTEPAPEATAVAEQPKPEESTAEEKPAPAEK